MKKARFSNDLILKALTIGKQPHFAQCVRSEATKVFSFSLYACSTSSLAFSTERVSKVKLIYLKCSSGKLH